MEKEAIPASWALAGHPGHFAPWRSTFGFIDDVISPVTGRGTGWSFFE